MLKSSYRRLSRVEIKQGKIEYAHLNEFDMTVRYIDDDMVAPKDGIGQHNHDECEIYVHLEGDVSFMVEDKIYPIRYGDVVITRPHEYHHCIYHSKTKHKHFWILFSAKNNEWILKKFFSREKGEKNLFCLDPEKTKELVDLCYRLCSDVDSDVEKYYCFFKLLRLIEQAKDGENREDDDAMSKILLRIHRCYFERVTIKELAQDAYVSVSTLERKFEQYFNVSPYEYIKRVRIANVARLLLEGKSVTESAETCGFSDVSAMITFFKKQYGVTPLQYKRKFSIM